MIESDEMDNVKWLEMDNVKWLREAPQHEWNGSALNKCANEIERLREEAVMFRQSWIKAERENAALREENARLREAVKNAYYEGWQDSASRDYSPQELNRDWEASEAHAAIREGGKDG